MYEGGDLGLMGVAYDERDSGKRRNFFRGALGIAAGYNDSCFGILPADSPDGGASILIRACRNGAGVQNYDRRLLWVRGAGETLLFELAFKGGAVGLRGAATEVFYVISGHISIVWHFRLGVFLSS